MPAKRLPPVLVVLTRAEASLVKSRLWMSCELFGIAGRALLTVLAQAMALRIRCRLAG